MSRPPPAFWLIPSAVAALHMVPLLSLGWAPPPDGQTFVGVSYLPKDFLAYAAFIRQVPQDGSLLFYNPFTTEPQSSRFLLLFHWLVGLGARVTGLSAIDALEWSRVPLIFLFFATLWWFLRPLLPEAKDRLTAAVLVGFASGIEGWVRPFLDELPGGSAEQLLWESSTPMGWSVSASLFNPLWIAALILAMLVLRPLLFSSRPSLGTLTFANAVFVLLFCTHPYTAVGVLAIAGIGPVVALLSGGHRDLGKHVIGAMGLAPAALAMAELTLWQMQDSVFRASSGGVFGSQNLSVLWYPVTLGLLGVMAVLGARRWIAAEHPFRFAIFGWIAGVVLLHWLPFLNGYKFVFLLPLPLCVLAAPVAREVLFERRRWPALVAGIVLFSGVAFHTVEGIRSTRSAGAFPSVGMDLVKALATRPAGNALVPPRLGNLLPAFSPHRVWIGHWFLTPDVVAREATYNWLMQDRDAARRLRNLWLEQRLRYVAVPAGRATFVESALAGSVIERVPVGELELFILREPDSRAGS